MDWKFAVVASPRQMALASMRNIVNIIRLLVGLAIMLVTIPMDMQNIRIIRLIIYFCVSGKCVHVYTRALHVQHPAPRRGGGPREYV